MADQDSKQRLSRSRASWLESHSQAWVSDGLIDDASRARIIASYEIDSAERRSLMALMLLGALMFGIGVLLLIGYNWARLPVPGKIALIMSSVALAFGASAATFARRHRLAGEILAFIGVGLYGNAIWLIAQVLHIRGNFSDAFMWWAIGALACAWLIRSRIVGVGAAALVLIWALVAGHTLDRPVLSFVTIWIVAVAVAYKVHSPLMLAPAALSAVAWACWVPDRVQPELVSVGMVALMGCAFYALGAWHPLRNPLGRAWELTALAALVVAFVPLLMTEFHRNGGHSPVTWASLAMILPALLTAGSLAVVRRRQRSPDAGVQRVPLSVADVAVLITTTVVTSWLGLMALGFAADPRSGYAATVAFSVVALGLSVSLIHKALDSDSAPDLTFGVLFALVFLLVRWASLIDSMLWSGAMLLVASAGFFAIARLWSKRARRRPAPLEMASTGGAR